jgi:DNA (cytosine-5)-methyltransferase 1
MTFIDLFAGIGGFRMGFEQEGYNCLFSAEINSHCQQVYQNNFGEAPFSDVTEIDSSALCKFDVLLAGFPCQPFSISGYKKGFEDTRGTLFFDIARIINDKKPPVVVLENVKHLVHHDQGRTLKVIIETLESMNYFVSWKVLNAKDFAIPQNGERIIIIASQYRKFDFQKINKEKSLPLEAFLDKDGDFEFLREDEYTLIDNPKTQESGLIFVGYRNKNIWKKGVRENTEHLSRVHRQPNRIYSVKGIHPTIPSQETSGRFFIYIPEIGKVRKLTINECYKIMGYPNNFIKSQKQGEAYKQIGNSVAVPMIRAIAKSIKEQGLLDASQRKINPTISSLFGIGYADNCSV